MLQQEAPEDYVIATGETRKLEDFVCEAFGAVGLDWREHVQSNPLLIRPMEILTIRANPGKANRKMGWKARYGMEQVVRMMVEEERKGLDGLSKGKRGNERPPVPGGEAL